MKDGMELVSGLISKGKLNPLVLKWLQYEGFSRTYGWTIKQIDEQPIMGIRAYRIINGSRNRREENG